MAALDEIERQLGKEKASFSQREQMRSKSRLTRTARQFRLAVYRRGYVRLYGGTLHKPIVDVIGQVPRDAVTNDVVRSLV